MARYIDADELLNKLPDDLPYKASVKRVLIQAKEADVVPKSEVEIWKQNRFNLYQRLELYEMTRQKVAREIFEEIEEGIKAAFAALQFERNPIHRKVKNETYSSLMRFIVTVEKKYTEGEE